MLGGEQGRIEPERTGIGLKFGLQPRWVAFTKRSRIKDTVVNAEASNCKGQCATCRRRVDNPTGSGVMHPFTSLLGVELYQAIKRHVHTWYRHRDSGEWVTCFL